MLEARGLLDRKGFPESYDVRRLLRFMADLKSGAPEVFAPVYSHLAYDVVEGEQIAIRQPDIVIVEGLNVLQTGSGRAPMFVSDFFDFSIYVDANEADIEQWYVERFMALRETVFRNPSSYFHRYADLTPDEAPGDRPSPVADDQSGEPAGERAADARSRPSHSRERARSRGTAGAAAKVVVGPEGPPLRDSLSRA